MKLITQLFLIIIAITIGSTLIASQEVRIRPGKLKDLAAINNLCDNEHHTGGFKEGLRKAFNIGIMPDPTTQKFFNSQLNLFAERQKYANTNAVQGLDQHHILVAYLHDGTTKKFAGYCLFNQENSKQICISYLIVDKEFGNGGIGKHLIKTAFKTFNGITSGRFRWLAYDTTMTNLFEKYCIEIDNTYLDYAKILEYVSSNIITIKIAPIIFKEYIFSLKKFEHS